MQVNEDGQQVPTPGQNYARDPEDAEDEQQQQQQQQLQAANGGGDQEQAASTAAEQQQQQQNSSDDQEVQKRVAAVQVQVQGMEGDWRAYCEHPLSVATAAMLNLQQQHQVTAVAGHPADEASYVYEYYTKLPDKASDVKLPPTHELWST